MTDLSGKRRTRTAGGLRRAPPCGGACQPPQAPIRTQRPHRAAGRRAPRRGAVVERDLACTRLSSMWPRSEAELRDAQRALAIADPPPVGGARGRAGGRRLRAVLCARWDWRRGCGRSGMGGGDGDARSPCARRGGRCGRRRRAVSGRAAGAARGTSVGRGGAGAHAHARRGAGRRHWPGSPAPRRTGVTPRGRPRAADGRRHPPAVARACDVAGRHAWRMVCARARRCVRRCVAAHAAGRSTARGALRLANHRRWGRPRGAGREPRHRTPEPLRHARWLARMARARGDGEIPAPASG